jgi:hypothetical protein
MGPPELGYAGIQMITMVRIAAPVMLPILRPLPSLSDLASATIMQASGHFGKEFWYRISFLEKKKSRLE